MALTTIGQQLTPGRPVQITFAPSQTPPNPLQQLVLIGHMGASGTAASGSYSAASGYVPYIVSNVANPTAASGEVAALFGQGSELTRMVVAAVNGNYEGLNTNFPPITVIPLYSSDTGFGNAFNALSRMEAEIVVSPYDPVNQTLTQAFITQLQSMSGPQNVENNQFGSIGVVANRSISAAGSLPEYDTASNIGQLVAVWKRDSLDTNPVGMLAAGVAAVMAANPVPFNPLDNVQVGGVVPPALLTDYITVGAGLESETALSRGWCPLRVLPNGEVTIVRNITTRLTVDGITPISDDAYVDAQDFQVLFYWRKTVWTRLNQPDLKQVKASNQAAQTILSEILRLANVFQDNGMFQAVQQLAPYFKVARNATDRSRFDILTPVNVIPGLHVVAVNVQATTQFDTLTF
jgi:phage tail sheath gpL-like